MKIGTLLWAVIATAGCSGTNGEIENACVSGFGGAKLSDVFEQAKENGTSIVSETTEKGVIMRLSKTDDLTNRDNELSFEFQHTDSPSTAKRCGPRVVRIGRAVVNGQIIQARDAYSLLASMLIESVWYKERVALQASQKSDKDYRLAREGAAKSDAYLEEEAAAAAVRDSVGQSDASRSIPYAEDANAIQPTSAGKSQPQDETLKQQREEERIRAQQESIEEQRRIEEDDREDQRLLDEIRQKGKPPPR